MDFEPERRGSRSRALERSISYSAAIGSGSGRSSIEIPSMVNTDVYANEELKKQYRISQTYVEGREIAFPSGMTNIETTDTIPSSGDGLATDASHYSSEDDQTDNGLTLTIDVEYDSPKSESTRHISNASTQPLVSSSAPMELYDRIDVLESIYDEPETIMTSAAGYSTPYTRRKKGKHR